ncbi:MAG: cytochrome c-type biosis protein CcmE [Actinomycetota bacterium]
MDLTPRTPADGPQDGPAVGKKRKRAPAVIVVLALVFGGVVVTKFLTSAIDYYCNVDEVGVRSGCNGERRIRIQGIVKKDSLSKSDGTTTFVMEWNKKEVKVSYLGDPGGIFQECIPVVAHGRMNGDVFNSDRIEVKHSNQYVEKNKARFDAADKEAAACSVSQG